MMSADNFPARNAKTRRPDQEQSERMSNTNDLHMFRVQTPSFLIANSSAEAQNEISFLQQQRLMVDQLRKEAALKRVNVSKAIEDLKKYIHENESEDFLIVGFPSQKSNPYREKSSCNVL